MKAHAMAVVVCVLLLALASSCTVGFSSGSSVCRPQPGAIVFGADLEPNFTGVSGCSGAFLQEGDLALVGTFPRLVTGRITLEATRDGEPLPPFFATFTSPTNYFSSRFHLIDFPGPGQYVFKMKLGSELLATGAFHLSD